MMAELSMVDRWVRFCPLCCGLCLKNLSCPMLVIASRSSDRQGGRRSDVKGTPKRPVAQMVRADVASLITFV